MKNINTEEFQKLAGEWRRAEESRNMAKASCAWQALVAHIEAWGAQQRDALSVAHAELSDKYSALSAESVADGLTIVELRATITQLRERAEKAEAALAQRAASAPTAVVYPEDGTVSPFTVINLGRGEVKIGDSIHDDRLPALWFGKDGTGMGDEEVLNRAAKEGETLAVVTFANVDGLDVLAEVVSRIRREKFPAARAVGGVDLNNLRRLRAEAEIALPVHQGSHASESCRIEAPLPGSPVGSSMVIYDKGGHTPEQARYITALLNAAPSLLAEAPSASVCAMCNGHSLVGCMAPEGGEAWPCPDCEGAGRIAPPAAVPAFQQRVQPWMMACFGAEISADRAERNHRFFEEATELVQSCDMTAGEAHQLVDYVYGRPMGEPQQEVGGVMVTLAALCLAQGMDMHQCGETELARIWTMVEKIRAKQAAKPKHSPLPAATVASAGPTHDEEAAIRLRAICDRLGIGSHVPQDNATLWGAAFAVLGQIRAALDLQVTQPAGDERDNDYFCHLIEQTVDAGGFDVDTPAGVDAALHAVARAAIAAKQPAQADDATLIRKLVTGAVGRATLQKLADGQGTETEDGKAWLAAQAAIAAQKGGT